ncbi:MAG: serine hydrolase [Bacteroidota bacterium]
MNRKNLLLGLALCSTIGFIQCQPAPVDPAITNPDPDNWEATAEALMEYHKVPGVSVLLLGEDGAVVPHTFGVQQVGSSTGINEETIFSVGSVSKVVSAVLALRLVNDGLLDLDTDINTYLDDWKVKENRFTRDQPVTIRHILSHTAGFSVHGFLDFNPGERLPTTLQILNGQFPAKNQRVRVTSTVGEKFNYSGGGITVLQKIIEDVTGQPFHEVATQLLFDPLGLVRTTFENPLPASYGNIAKAHNRLGKPTALPRGYQSMPEAAASGLWTTPSELMIILDHVMEAHATENSDFLSAELVEDMITPEQNSRFGLGPIIRYQDGRHEVWHGGSNNSYKSIFKLFWNESSGYIIFTNGARGTDFIKDLSPVLEDHMLGAN